MSLNITQLTPITYEAGKTSEHNLLDRDCFGILKHHIIKTNKNNINKIVIFSDIVDLKSPT